MKGCVLCVLISLFSIFNIGCGSKDTFYPKNFKSLPDELSKADFSCANKRNCPDNVGMIFSNSFVGKKDPELSYCTGFLVKNDIVATNRHCVPEHLRGVFRRRCKDGLAVRFNTERGEEIYECEELISYSSENDNRDYAFFKIRTTNIQPLKISKRGLIENQIAKVMRFTPFAYKIGGRLEMSQCQIVTNSLMNFFSTLGPWTETAMAMGCPAVGGNSGSPILNENNEVVGVLQAYLIPAIIDSIARRYSKFNLALPGVLPIHAMFTNLSCVDDPLNGHNHKSLCNEAKSLNVRTCLNKPTPSLKDLDVFYNQWIETLPGIFRYDIVKDINNKQAWARPRCIVGKSNSTELKRYLSVNSSGGHKYQVSASFIVQPQFQRQILDDFRIAIAVNEFENPYRELILQFSEGVEDREVWVGELIGATVDNERMVIPSCTPGDQEQKNKNFIQWNDFLVAEKDFYQNIDDYLGPYSAERLCSLH